MDPSLRRLTRELKQCSIEGVSLEVDESDLFNLVAYVEGPDGTPYASGRFKIRCCFGDDWPAAPPKCAFETKIFHPNVSPKGEICVNTLKKDWRPTHTISHILTTIKCLLIYPNPESALNEEAGRLLLERYEDFARAASLMTSVHAGLGDLTTKAPLASRAPSSVHKSTTKSNRTVIAQDEVDPMRLLKPMCSNQAVSHADPHPFHFPAQRNAMASKQKKTLRRL